MGDKAGALRVPMSGIPFELIDAEDFRKEGRERESHGQHDGRDGLFGDAEFLSNLSDRGSLLKGPADP